MRLPTVRTQWPVAISKIRLAFCGEAAGADEEKYGRPFVGRAGQLLDKILSTAQIPRQYVMITNVFQLRPPGNKILEFFTRPAITPPFTFSHIYQGMGVDPELWSEIARLIGELHLWQPHVIIALGNTALWATTSLQGIGQYRGKTCRCTLPGLSHMPVVPTWHPSYLLRKEQMSKEYSETVLDINAAKTLAVANAR